MTSITLGHLRDTLHAGCAAAVARVLDAYEMDVSFVDASPDELPDMLEAGEIDLLVSVWLPRDEKLVNAGFRSLGELYLPQNLWAATAPLPPIDRIDTGDVACVITTPELAPVVQAALETLPALRGVSIEIVDDEAIYDRVIRFSEARPCIVALAQPHALFHADVLHQIEDPEFRLGREMRACMILREGVASRLDSDMLDELSEMMLGNKVMSALDYLIRVEGVDPEDAAESWQRGRLIPR